MLVVFVGLWYKEVNCLVVSIKDNRVFYAIVQLSFSRGVHVLARVRLRLEMVTDVEVC